VSAIAAREGRLRRNPALLSFWSGCNWPILLYGFLLDRLF
jgi:hypothetical protein